MRLADGFDLNSRVSRIRVTAAGFDQFDTLAVSVVIVRYFIYLIAAAFVHDYDERLVIAAAFTEIVIMAFTVIYTFKRDILASMVLRLIGGVMLAGAGIAVIYVNGIITTYLTDVQKRESIIVLLVIFNILFAVVETASLVMSLDVFLAASTSRHRKSTAKEFKTRIKPTTQLAGTCICFLLLVLPAGISGSIISGLDNVRIDSKVYQVVDSDYVFYDYPATARKRNNGSVLTYDNDTERMLADTPVYFGSDGNTERIMMSKAYAIVEPLISSTKKVDTLTTIAPSEIGGSYIINSEDREREATGFFLYDGSDAYVFFDELALTVGDDTFTISPFTYVKATYNGAIMIFDPALSSIKTYSLIGKEAGVSLKDGTQLDIVTDILLKTDGSEQMLFVQPQNLEEYVG